VSRVTQPGVGAGVSLPAWVLEGERWQGEELTLLLLRLAGIYSLVPSLRRPNRGGARSATARGCSSLGDTTDDAQAAVRPQSYCCFPPACCRTDGLCWRAVGVGRGSPGVFPRVPVGPWFDAGVSLVGPWLAAGIPRVPVEWCMSHMASAACSSGTPLPCHSTHSSVLSPGLPSFCRGFLPWQDWRRFFTG